MARELAEVSLWLNCIHRGGHVPWFGYQLVCGNSLVGARRQVYATTMLGTENKKSALWFNHAPERVAPPDGARPTSPGSRADIAASVARDRAATRAPQRPADAVYHFLLPDPGMAAYADKAAKALEPECFARIADWRKRFFRPFTDGQIAELEALSDRVDALWALHAEQLARDRAATEDALPVWGRRDADERRTANAWKDDIRDQGVFSRDTRSAGPYRRLKLVMDYWCALWFWPIRDADRLPDRDEFLNEISLVLTGSVYQPGVGPQQTADLFGAEYAEHAADIAQRITDAIGMLDLEKLFEQFPRLRFVDELAGRHRFHHWELAFADVFYGGRADGSIRGGFERRRGVAIASESPRPVATVPAAGPVECRAGASVGLVASAGGGRYAAGGSASALSPPSGPTRSGSGAESTPTAALGLRDVWRGELEQVEATQSFLSARQNYPLLVGHPNLYKCFLPQAWMIKNRHGVAGLLHPESVYDEPKGGAFRAALYARLRPHFEFQNEKRLFADVHHETLFSVNVHGRPRAEPQFTHIANLFAPATVDACLDHDGGGGVPGIKDDADDWNTAGHADRIVDVDPGALQSFATLYDEPGTPPERARLPALHARRCSPCCGSWPPVRDGSAISASGSASPAIGTRAAPSAMARFVAKPGSRRVRRRSWCPVRTSSSATR